MKNKSMKWIALIMAVSMMAISLVACGGNTEPDSSVPVSDTSTESKTETTALSEEEYIAKIKEIHEGITKVSTEIMANVDTTDVEALVSATKEMIEAVKPSYVELRDLIAPEKYAEAQAKIKRGCEASLRSLEISLEMFDNMTDADKIAELQQEASDLESTVLELAEGLAEAGLADLQ